MEYALYFQTVFDILPLVLVFCTEKNLTFLHLENISGWLHSLRLSEHKLACLSILKGLVKTKFGLQFCEKIPHLARY